MVSNIKRIVLFRFHRNALVCKNKLELLQKFNPGIKVFGLFGGRESELVAFKKVLKLYLKNIYCIKGKSKYWKWANSDLAIRQWYKDYGKKLTFDVLHFIEWDMLLFAPISKLYKHIPKDGVGLTGLTKLKKIEKRWDWMYREPYRSRWAKLFEFVKDKYAYNKEPYACIGGGPCLPKKFLEKYAAIDVPELAHDELRYPLFAQILGFKLYDTKFYRKFFDKNEERFFNAEKQDIKLSVIKKELSKSSGRRVFHPYRKVWRLT